jgi:glucose 1-dehydrogenase
MAARLQDKIALVTGGSQGIGKDIAITFAREGAHLIIDYRSERDLAMAGEVKAEIEKIGRRCAIVQADLSSLSEIDQLITTAVKDMGRIDILVNNAGLEKRASFWDITEADFDLVFNVDLKGLFFTTQAFVREAMKQKYAAKIINISSVHEELPFPHFTAYCVSKGGVKMMTRNLAIELAPYSITINSIAPGAIETPINKGLLSDKTKLASLLGNIPLGRLGQPQDVSGVAVFLGSSDADYMTGTTVFVDGGLLWNYQEQ